MEVSILLDFYGRLLKDKVRIATEMYFNDDLSLSEIADDLKITRQGVRDLVKRAEVNLYDYEEKLGLYQRFLETQKGLKELKEKLLSIKSSVNSNVQNFDIDENFSQVISIVDKLIDNE